MGKQQGIYGRVVWDGCFEPDCGTTGIIAVTITIAMTIVITYTITIAVTVVSPTSGAAEPSWECNCFKTGTCGPDLQNVFQRDALVAQKSEHRLAAYRVSCFPCRVSCFHFDALIHFQMGIQP